MHDFVFAKNKGSMELFGKLAWPRLSDNLVELCLKKVIPEEISKLSSYQIIVNFANDFESKLIDLGNFQNMQLLPDKAFRVYW